MKVLKTRSGRPAQQAVYVPRYRWVRFQNNEFVDAFDPRVVFVTIEAAKKFLYEETPITIGAERLMLLPFSHEAIPAIPAEPSAIEISFDPDDVKEIVRAFDGMPHSKHKILHKLRSLVVDFYNENKS